MVTLEYNPNARCYSCELKEDTLYPIVTSSGNMVAICIICLEKFKRGDKSVRI